MAIVLVLAAGATAAALGVAVASRLASDGQMLVELRRILSMHHQISAMVDSLDEGGRAAAADAAMAEGTKSMSDLERGPDSVLNAFAVLVRLGQPDRACGLAAEGARRLGPGANRGSIRWLDVAAKACEAAQPDAGAAELASVAEAMAVISEGSPADDFLLGCYVEAMAVQAGDPGFRRLAMRIDGTFNRDPSVGASWTMLALVAMAEDVSSSPDPSRLGLVLRGIERWAAWPVREYNSIAYLNLLFRLCASCAKRGDRAAFDGVVPLVRAAADRADGVAAKLTAETWIGCQLFGFGDLPSAARVLDGIAGIEGIASVDPGRLAAWLPYRVAIALDADDPRAAVSDVLALVDGTPALGTGDPELLVALRAWSARDPSCIEPIGRWRMRGGGDGDWVGSLRDTIADRLVGIAAGG